MSGQMKRSLSLTICSICADHREPQASLNVVIAGTGPRCNRAQVKATTWYILHHSYCSLCHSRNLKGKVTANDLLSCSVKRPKTLFPSLPKHLDLREGRRGMKEPGAPWLICLLVPPCVEMSPGSQGSKRLMESQGADALCTFICSRVILSRAMVIWWCNLLSVTLSL